MTVVDGHNHACCCAPDLQDDTATPDPPVALAQADDPEIVRTIAEANPKRSYGVG